MLFPLLKHYLDTGTALKVSQSVYCFTTSISHGVENFFPRLWGTGISDAIFLLLFFSLLFSCERSAFEYSKESCEMFTTYLEFVLPQFK